MLASVEPAEASRGVNQGHIIKLFAVVTINMMATDLCIRVRISIPHSWLVESLKHQIKIWRQFIITKLKIYPASNKATNQLHQFWGDSAHDATIWDVHQYFRGFISFISWIFIENYRMSVNLHRNNQIYLTNNFLFQLYVDLQWWRCI